MSSVSEVLKNSGEGDGLVRNGALGQRTCLAFRTH